MAGPRKNRRILETTLGLLALAVTAAILPAAGPAATSASADSASPAHTPSLAGTWTLNEDLTLRLQEGDRERGTREKQDYGHQGGGRRGGGPGTGGPPGGPGGVGPGGDGDPGESGGPILGEMPFPREDVQRPSFVGLAELTITQQGRQVTITDKAGNVRVLTTDGSKVKDAKGPDGPTEVQAKWEKDGSLTVVVKPAKGPKRVESYIVSNDRKHLYVVFDIGGDAIRAGIKIRRAYDPITPAAAPAEKPAPAETPGEEDELA
jgi:hypothetical protein